MFETTCREGVCRLGRPGTRWLSTGYAGGESHGSAAYNVTVPDGWSKTDLDAYIDRRVTAAGFDDAGPVLLTGVAQQHARRARFGPVEVVATAGVSNPAALPMDGSVDECDRDRDGSEQVSDADHELGDTVGTVNIVVGTTRSLEPGALSNLVAVAAEAKAATLLSRCRAPGTTSDAIIAACDPDGESVTFSGSATTVGHAARICVRDAVAASLDSRYEYETMPQRVAEAPYGVVADDSATVSKI
ncbi:adenosylcobinamide amidohydrolase [Haloferax mucosum ATCC BAA-1512]|uniref:Adenosylcobinamide amidohydrolase n=1 Tax=Haloferax mucosum ATCC BAA-1512 TaxID=662479 RepID=M0I586_9EURY|nr:adenosylcobinamide amidohydrolase [Haloferax mucosum]ELZ91945.1 adenosylcobinamide amidohydrolase [Haloferax mucosum ATCC BAA-1512]